MGPPGAKPTLDDSLQAARAGDEAAFAHLFRHTHPGLLAYLGTLAGPEGDDLAAEVWIHVIRGLDNFNGNYNKFRGWVFTIAHSRWVDHVRAHNRRAVVVDDELFLDTPSPRSVEEEAEENLATQRAIELLTTLPRDQAQVVLLRAVAGLDVAHTAKILGKRRGAVRTLAHRGLRALATRLGRHRPTSLIGL